MTSYSPTPCLWFATEAEEAAKFYTSLIADSRIDKIHHAVADDPGGKAGRVLLIEFTLGGRAFQALNGGVAMPPTDAVSLSLTCDGQAEVDRLWAAFTKGGKEVQCGWVKDRWGFSWQIVPKQYLDMMASPDRAAAARATQAMLKMVKLDVATLQRAFEGRA